MCIANKSMYSLYSRQITTLKLVTSLCSHISTSRVENVECNLSVYSWIENRGDDFCQNP